MICFGEVCTRPLTAEGTPTSAVMIDADTVAVRNFDKIKPPPISQYLYYYKCYSSGECDAGIDQRIKCTPSDLACRNFIKPTIQSFTADPALISE